MGIKTLATGYKGKFVRPTGYKYPLGLTSFSVSSNVATNTTGGTQTIDGDNAVHIFTTSGFFEPSFTGNVECLVIGGGGTAGASAGTPGGGGGGGAGAVIYASSITISESETYNVVVGAATGNSSFSNSTSNVIVAHYGGGSDQPGGSGGGGYGSRLIQDGTINRGSGGSAVTATPGGGTSYGFSGGFGVSAGFSGPQGFNPIWQSGGGGGAGSAGYPGSPVAGGPGPAPFLSFGGNGIFFSISGANTGYAGGGGGMSNGSPRAASPWSPQYGSNTTNALQNRGSGGSGPSGQGGSGLIVVRYISTQTTSDFRIE